MAVGKSLHIGLNLVDPNAYGGWDGKLTACEFDAKDMQTLATGEQFQTKLLLTRQASRAAVLDELRDASSTLNEGDVFLITYSGHGGQVPDRNNDEDDYRDETWCLYDGQLIDDELYAVWATFKPNVKIVVLSDSCHSGSVIKLSPPTSAATAMAGLSAAVAASADPATHVAVPREMPVDIISRAYHAKKSMYDELQAGTPKTEDDVQASVLLISGCQDNQFSMDGPFNGAFTGALLRVWNEGSFKGTYRTFHSRIQRQLPPSQQPNLMTIGAGKRFARTRPFRI